MVGKIVNGFINPKANNYRGLKIILLASIVVTLAGILSFLGGLHLNKVCTYKVDATVVDMVYKSVEEVSGYKVYYEYEYNGKIYKDKLINLVDENEKNGYEKNPTITLYINPKNPKQLIVGEPSNLTFATPILFIMLGITMSIAIVRYTKLKEND